MKFEMHFSCYNDGQNPLPQKVLDNKYNLLLVYT